MILQSKLLSGGMESRFLGLFSNDGRAKLTDLHDLTNDDELNKMIKAGCKEIEEDTILTAVVE